MARDRVTCSSGTEVTLVSGGAVYGPKRKMSHIIIKNVGAEVVYLQWTEEDTPLSASNGFPLEAGETFSMEFKREGQPYAPDVLALSPSGTTVVYSAE